MAATRPEVLAALSRMFWQALQRHYRAWEKDGGVEGGDGEPASIAKLLAALHRPARLPPPRDPRS